MEKFVRELYLLENVYFLMNPFGNTMKFHLDNIFQNPNINNLTLLGPGGGQICPSYEPNHPAQHTIAEAGENRV